MTDDLILEKSTPIIKDNADNLTELWYPDKALCAEAEEFRSKNEWMRKKTGVGGKRPNQLGMQNYRYGNQLHAKFFEGQNPPPVPLDSLENLEWYAEQLSRCVYGYEYKNQRVTGDEYWFLNFNPFKVIKKDKYGQITTEFDIGFPYYSTMHDYIFKCIEQAKWEHKGFMWFSGRGVGKEQPHYEHIMTPDGITTMGEVSVGSIILGSNGKPTKVLAKYPQGVKDVYRLTFKDGRHADCGLDHLWTLQTNKGKSVTLKLSDFKDDYLSNRGDSKYYMKNAECSEFNKQSVDIDPYVLGTLIGDGGLTQATRITSEDQEILDRVSNNLGSKYKLNHLSNYDYSISYEKHGKNPLLDSIRNLKLNTKSGNKFIPREYIYNSKEIRLELLRGLMDTDGTISKNGVREFNTVSTQLAKDVAFLCRSLGMWVVCSDKKGKYKGKEHLSKRVRIYTDLRCFHLPRKASREIDSKYRRQLREKTGLIKVELLANKSECSCITVDAEDSLYLTRDFIVTHNTYVALSIPNKLYHLKRGSHSTVSASNSKHADECFSKFLEGVDATSTAHPTLHMNRLVDTKTLIQSGQEVVRDGVKIREGSKSKVNKIIYGDNPGATRGSRPDFQLYEEAGDWASGVSSLKECYAATVGSTRVGSISKCFNMMIGTGGSVKTDQVKSIFLKPDAYNMLPMYDFAGEFKKSCFFLPADWLMGGQRWEETGVNNNDGARAFLEEERERIKDDIELFVRLSQEYPLTINEVFRQIGTNIFNQTKIAQQWMRLERKEEVPAVRKGMLEWIRTTGGKITGVKFSENPEGNIELIEEPYRGRDGNTVVNNLYVAGIDGIDQGNLDSTSTKNRSSLACLIKKRIVDGGMFSQTSNIYVAKYLNRSDDIRDDYEEVLKLCIFYNSEANIEHTKIGIINYFREKGFHRLIMKRPSVTLPNSGDGTAKRMGVDVHSNLVGTLATGPIIDYQDGKVKEYVNDYYYNIFFPDMLTQLRDYQRERRTPYDLVIAMGLCELADEDHLGMAAREDPRANRKIKAFGYYKDPMTGYMKFGVLPGDTGMENIIKADKMAADWIDCSGQTRFDNSFSVLNKEDLY